MGNVINFLGNEHNVDDWTDNQKKMLDQITDLEAQMKTFEMQLEQRQVAHSAYVQALMNSLQEENEEELQKESQEEEVANG
tara:strand:+ start:49 stop:291 length:243 start_codon:yes stop_codon:yes gene_type:complete